MGACGSGIVTNSGSSLLWLSKSEYMFHLDFPRGVDVVLDEEGELEL